MANQRKFSKGAFTGKQLAGSVHIDIVGFDVDSWQVANDVTSRSTMPHLIIEYTDNIIEEPRWNDLYRDIHAVLIATSEWYSPDIKSRAIRLTNYCVGNGSPDQAFISLTIQILAGRSDDLKQSVSENCLKILASYFHRTLEKLRSSVTVQIVDIHAPSYSRRINYEV